MGQVYALLGEGGFTIEDNTPHDGLLRSEVLVCECCGEVWGRFYSNAQWWGARLYPCSRHGGGSFFQALRHRILPSFMPEELLRYEIMAARLDLYPRAGVITPHETS